MSAVHRCRACGHPGGTKRRVANLSKADAHKPNPTRAHGEQAAKPACQCVCHA